MQSKLLLSIVGLVGAVSAATTCHADNCLRAIRATSRLAQASADCSSYLLTTVTPDTVTITEYSTISEVAEETVLTTDVETFFETSTLLIPATATVEQPGTLITVTSYDPALKKRQVAPTIPAYASPCSSAPRFTSACSCIGIPGPITVTAPTPSVTVTLSTTVTYSTETEISTVETLSVTITDATVSVATVEETTTTTGPATTVTVTAPIPDLCKNIVMYNGLRAQTGGVPIISTTPWQGAEECCLRCFVTLDCIAFV
ncbi:hypothetical protein ABW19_dt0209559 [Dactylella cylindrospora]|nr:hypothetical protein ABW19_dt0209559 [Dactylella cylindrospora]